MTKKDYAKQFYFQLKSSKNVQETINSIKLVNIDGAPLNIDEQLEMLSLIRTVHIEQSRSLFESADAFLALIRAVEEQILNTQSEYVEKVGGEINNANK